MAVLTDMPPIGITTDNLLPFAQRWTNNGKKLSRTPPHSSNQLGELFNQVVGRALAAMLGGIPVVAPKSMNSLLPPRPDCVEVGPVRIVGGVRPQNFDVGYRPDGVRFALDTKTLNDLKSVGKNYQNMINDLATEATTVHTRFPFAVVAFVVVIPSPCLVEPQRSGLTGRLDGLARRESVEDPDHLAEAISLVVWSPADGTIDNGFPPQTSPLRIERLHKNIQNAYFRRYQGLPPHTA
jgi:hypothetical protein